MTEPQHKYPYPRPALTVDALIFHFSEGSLNLLLIQRGDEPYKGSWAFPGGFVNENETVEQAVVRELKEETGIEATGLQQVFTASAPGRDPRGWTVSVIFIGFIKDGTTLKAGDDAADARWHPLRNVTHLAFDHADIVDRVRLILKRRMKYGELIHYFLGKEFTQDEFIRLYKNIFDSEKEVGKVIRQLILIKKLFLDEQTGLMYFLN